MLKIALQKTLFHGFVSLSLLMLIAGVSVADDKEKTPEKKTTAKKTEKKTEAKPTVIKLADGKLSLAAPAAWIKKKPANRIIEFEFSAPKVEGDAIDGRITIMGAGGTVDANIARWQAQFSGSTKSTKKEIKVAGCKVHLVDITGSYKDRRGPFAPATLRKSYRMIAAIIVTEKLGQYFVKMYGPEKTIAAQEKAFLKLVNSLKLGK